MATGPRMMSLSTVMVTPPQVSAWSPRYCLARCHSAHRALSAVGHPVSEATPSQRAIHTASGRASEVEKYFIWRQLDASANSLNMLASAHYSHEELLGKSEAEKHDLLHAKGLNWAKEPADFKRGRAVRRNADGEWAIDLEIPIFQRDLSYLRSLSRL